jgi:TET-associated glycosyltransferase-like protein
VHITIPTYGRADRQLTHQLFPHARLVVQDREKHLYAPSKTMVLPPDVTGIAATRDAIIKWCYPDYVIMLDDDLNFAVRREDAPAKFRPAYGVDYKEMIQQIVDCLELFPHVSMSPRQGANRETGQFLYNGRCMRVHGFNTKILVDNNIKGYHPDAPFMRDFYITLALLTRGYTNCILNWYVNDHPGSNVVPGGCTEQRSLELLKQSAEVLQSEFPDFVRLEIKQTKGSWEGKERYDVRISWKKAAEYGQRNRKTTVLDRGKGEDTSSERSGVDETLDR